MRKYLKLLVLVLVLMITGVTLVACGNKKNQDVTYRVTFNSCGGSEINSQEVAQNSKVKKVYPERNGYEFMGWYVDEKYGQKFDFNHEINSNINLFAKWSNNLDEIYSFEFTSSMKSYYISACHSESNILELPTVYDELPVVDIGENAFIENMNLQKIVIPRSIKGIGKNAFKNCLNLTELQILGNVVFGQGSFYNCQSLQKIYLATQFDYVEYDDQKICISRDSEIVDSIGDKYVTDNNIFYNAGIAGDGITLQLSLVYEVSNPNSVYRTERYGKIASNLFLPNQNLNVPKITTIELTKETNCFFPFTTDSFPYIKKIKIPNSISKIANNAFKSYLNLQSITIEDSIVDCENHAFSYLSNQVEINYQGSLKNYLQGNIGIARFDNYKINGEKIVDLVIPDGITKINTASFAGCKSIQSVVISDSVATIDEYAFNGCINLTSVTIINNQTELHSGAFLYCNNLSSLTLPENMIVDLNAFLIGDPDGLCDNNEITYLNKILKILPSQIKIKNWRYTFENDKVAPTIIAIPENVVSIAKRAILNIENVSIITIPNGIKNIPDYAFAGCKDLTSVVIPESVENIGEYAFGYCSKLTTINIPSSVRCIDKYAFAECHSLTSITIPNSVTSIGDYVFSGCGNLTSIIIPKYVKELGAGVINGCSDSLIVYCERSEPVYKYATGFETNNDDGYRWNIEWRAFCPRNNSETGLYLLPSENIIWNYVGE